VIQSPSPDVIVIGYGSLLSGLSLQPFGRLQVRSAARVVLLNARRGFGKFSQTGDHFAVVLDPVHGEQPIEARVLAADAPPGDAPEGIALQVQPNDLARLGDREGYSGGAVRRLRDEASRAHQDLPTFLWVLLSEAGSVAAFRQHLFQLVGYTSPHFIPHPVPLGGSHFAITFLAPGREGTGSARVVPVRIRTGNESVMTIVETWRRKPQHTQLVYFVSCLLGSVHGIALGDILAPLAEDAELCTRVRTAVSAESRRELARFLNTTGLDHAAYWEAFGPPNQAVRRSGLEQFLRGEDPGARR
jgi:hypothetical protein